LKWTLNYGIKEKEKIFTRKRFDTLLECLKTPEKIGELDKETVDLIELFKLELQKSLPAWNYIQDEQFKVALLKLNTIEHHLNGLKDDLISQIGYSGDTDPPIPVILTPQQDRDSKNLKD